MSTFTLINDTTPDRHIGCDAVMQTIRRAAAARGYLEVATHAAGSNITGADYPRLLSQSELILINGEGTLHDDSRGCKNIAHFAAVAKAAGKRVALINASYTDNSPTTTALLAGCDILAFRNQTSADQFTAQQPSAHTVVLADLSLQSFPPPATEPASRRSGRILVTDSVLPTATRHLFELALRLGCSYARVQESPKMTRANRPRNVLLSLCRQHPALALQAARFGSEVLRSAARHTFFKQAQQASLIITGRFHVVMFAVQQGIPFLFLPSNTAKIDHSLADIGIDSARRKLIDLSTVCTTPPTTTTLRDLARFTPEEMLARKDFLAQQASSVQQLMDMVFSS